MSMHQGFGCFFFFSLPLRQQILMRHIEGGGLPGAHNQALLQQFAENAEQMRQQHEVSEVAREGRGPSRQECGRTHAWPGGRGWPRGELAPHFTAAVKFGKELYGQGVSSDTSLCCAISPALFLMEPVASLSLPTCPRRGPCLPVCSCGVRNATPLVRRRSSSEWAPS